MDDVLTEAPPPSRFLEDELDNFAAPNPSLPTPFLLSNPNSQNPRNQNPNLLIILTSPTSLSLLPKTLTLASSLVLPDLPLSRGPHIDIYASQGDQSTFIAAVTCHVVPARAKPVAMLLLTQFPAERVLVFDSIRPENFRGRLDADEPMVFKMETREERRVGERGKMVKGVGWLGSGSLVEGLGAAVMGECEMRRRKGAVVGAVAGKEGRGVARVLKGVMMGLGIEVGDAAEDAVKVGSWLDSDLYT